MKAWQKFIILGLLVGLLNGVAMPIIITTVIITMGIILGGIPAPNAKLIYYMIFISIAVLLVIGVLFARYSTYEKGRRYAFKNFAIGFLFPAIIFSSLFDGIIQTVFVYLGCILGERWKKK
jgi:hypothetical protein